jgi:hypothetical protein
MQDTPLSTEEDHWAAAMAEIESGQRRPGIWAKAFAESDGDETKAKVAYLKARVAQLTAASSAESDARKEARDKERQRIAVEESLQFNIDQFKRNAWLSDEALRSVIAQAEHSILRSVTVDATGDTLLHLCSKRGLELEVRNLVAAGADQEKLNSQGKTAADFSTSEAVLLLLYGLAVFREDANKTRVVDVPASILKIKADLAKKNYIVEGGTIKEPFGAKVRVKSDIDFLEYAHSKLQS